MKRKGLLYIPLIAMLVISIMVNIAPAQGYSPAPSPNRIYLAPPEKKISTPYADVDQKLGELFNITARVENVTAPNTYGGLCGVEFKVWYNTTLLDVVAVTPLTPYVYWVDNSNDTLGLVWAVLTIGPPTVLSGDVDAVTMTFNVTYVPPYCETTTPPENVTVSTPLTLNETELVDKAGEIYDPTTYGVESGYYEYARACKEVGAPTAVFTWTPTVVYECSDVELDASGSDDGGKPPLTYLWTITNVTGNATLTGPNDAVKTTFHCDKAGNISVTLTVTNAIPLSDSKTETIEQLELIGCIIDLYSESEREYPPGTTTTRLGIGPNEPCDAYAPDEDVTLYASVTFNGAPRNLVLVGFEVIAPSVGSIDYLTATTNASGIATVSFRIPGATGNPWLFGKWLVIATCSVADVIQNDTLPFDVGWIAEITALWTTYNGLNETTFYTCDDKMDFRVIVKNIALIPKNVTIVVIVKDTNNVPIIKFVIPVTELPAGDYCDPEVTYHYMYFVHVPDWAYVGAATVYANVYTDLPINGGIPYCPQLSIDTILIKWGPRP